MLPRRAYKSLRSHRELVDKDHLTPEPPECLSNSEASPQNPFEQDRTTSVLDQISGILNGLSSEEYRNLVNKVAADLGLPCPNSVQDRFNQTLDNLNEIAKTLDAGEINRLTDRVLDSIPGDPDCNQLTCEDRDPGDDWITASQEDCQDSDLHDYANPQYYSQRKVAPIHLIESNGFGTGFNCGNAIKYVARHREKNGDGDLLKAVWYLLRELGLATHDIESLTSDISKLSQESRAEGDILIQPTLF